MDDSYIVECFTKIIVPKSVSIVLDMPSIKIKSLRILIRQVIARYVQIPSR
jgi:hypothetical protein